MGWSRKSPCPLRLPGSLPIQRAMEIGVLVLPRFAEKLAQIKKHLVAEPRLAGQYRQVLGAQTDWPIQLPAHLVCLRNPSCLLPNLLPHLPQNPAFQAEPPQGE